MRKKVQAHNFPHLRVKIEESVKFFSNTKETKAIINDDLTLNAFKLKMQNICR